MDDNTVLEDYFDFEGEGSSGSYEDDFEAYLGEGEDLEAYGGNFESWESNGGDPEGDLFLGGLVKQFIPKQLKQMAQHAAQSAGAAIGQQIGGRRGRQLGQLAGQFAGRLLNEAEYSGEWESQDESEGDWEDEVSDYELVEEMSFLAEQAVNANTDQEADEFIGALAQAAPHIISAAPALLDTGIKAIGSLFKPRQRPVRRRPVRRRPVRQQSREFAAENAVIQALPEITAKTAASLVQQANAGKPVTPERVAATLAKKTTEIVANPQKLAQAVKANHDKALAVKQRGGPRKYARRCRCCGKVTVRARGAQVV